MSAAGLCVTTTRANCSALSSGISTEASSIDGSPYFALAMASRIDLWLAFPTTITSSSETDRSQASLGVSSDSLWRTSSLGPISLGYRSDALCQF